MKRLVILGALLLAGCGSTTITATIVVSTATVTRPFLTASPAPICKVRDGGKLPDPVCTPGVVDPSVTQANIQKTICKPGYTKTVRPSTSYTNKLKMQQIALYGYRDKNLHNYEEDHLISLELGGSPSDPRNLWPEHPSSPNLKDKIENLLHARVCSGALTLKQAQQMISTNWTTVR